MKGFAAFLLCLILGFVGLALQGCGCDANSAGDCATAYTTDYAATTDVAAQCKALEEYTACINSKGCCADDALKKAMDTTVDSMNDYCKDNAITNKCS